MHTDVYGPIKLMLTRHNKYFLTFIDDYNSLIWVYFLKRMSKVLIFLKSIKQLLKNRVVITSETWDLIKVENIHQITLKFYVNIKALDNTNLYTTTEWCCWDK